ncbi:hypothetical protein COO60DRAFT_180012 [Scenedesmus sp. NREL 46B-D3]|nr:hypothetical protein COO60DRAFT_180012 [Scenedesmus sp. NREL 46B-D3]
MCIRLLAAAAAASSSSSSSTQTADEKAQNADAAAGAAAARFATKLQLPPVVVAAADSTGALAANASRAGAKQVSKLIKLVQQTSLLQAASLQLSSVWQSHSTVITSLAAAAATAGVYHLTYAAAACFVDMAAPNAVLACAGASAAAVAGLGLYVRSGFVVDPERVYQVAMRKLTQHAGLQEVMGAPLAGSPMRVQLVTRGSWFIQETLLPRRRAPRIHMLFPLSGPVQSGVVSLQAKKLTGGKYAFKTLLVELPSRALRGAEGTAAATAAAQQATAAQERSGTSSSNSSSSSTASGHLKPRVAAVGTQQQQQHKCSDDTAGACCSGPAGAAQAAAGVCASAKFGGVRGRG